MIHHDQSLFWGSVLPIDSAWGAQFINYIRARLIHACTLNVRFFGPSLTILLNRLPCARWNLQRAARTAVLLMCVEPAEVKSQSQGPVAKSQSLTPACRVIHHDQSLFWGSVLPIDSACGAQVINYIRAQLIHACTLNVRFFGPSPTILLNRLPCARWNLQRAGRPAFLLMCVEPAEVKFQSQGPVANRSLLLLHVE